MDGGEDLAGARAQRGGDMMVILLKPPGDQGMRLLNKGLIVRVEHMHMILQAIYPDCKPVSGPVNNLPNAAITGIPIAKGAITCTASGAPPERRLESIMAA